SFAAGPPHRQRDRCANRSATSRSSRAQAVMGRARRRVAPSLASPRPVPGSDATTRAGAGRARSTRSATVAEHGSPGSPALDHVIALYLAGLAPNLVVTGGKADGDRTTEAAAARAYAIARGVPEKAILLEDQSRTTQESIRAVSRVLRDHGLTGAVFVSDRP